VGDRRRRARADDRAAPCQRTAPTDPDRAATAVRLLAAAPACVGLLRVRHLLAGALRSSPESDARDALRDYAEHTGGVVIAELLTPLIDRALDAGLDLETIAALAEGRTRCERGELLAAVDALTRWAVTGAEVVECLGQLDRLTARESAGVMDGLALVNGQAMRARGRVAAIGLTPRQERRAWRRKLRAWRAS
jgi:hypothetical protein